MPLGARRITVDDMDVERVHYSGSWTTENGAHDDFSLVNGPTYEHSQHGTLVDGSSLSFAFNGSSIQLFGSWDVGDEWMSPTWECYLDGSKISSATPTPPSTNQNQLCWKEDISGKGEHELTVNVTASNTVNTEFWVDYLVYTPYEDEQYNDTTIWLSMTDGIIKYDGDWEKRDGAMMILSSGASLVATFNGTSIRLVGPIQNATYSSEGTFTVDDYTATFSVSKADGVNELLWSQTLFQSPDLDGDKEHKITVTWTGEDDQQKFGVENFYIHTARLAAPPEQEEKKSLSTALIAGLVVAGVVLLAAIGGFSWYWRRRHRYSSVSKTEMDLHHHDPFAAHQSFFPTHNSLSSTITPYDPYTSSSVLGMNVVPSSKAASMSASYSAVPTGSTSGPSTSSVFSASTASGQAGPSYNNSTFTLPPGAQSPPLIGTTTLTEQGLLVNMKNEQSYAVNRQSSLASASASAGPSNQDATTTFRKHQDSGIRLPRREEHVVDLPPDYAPS